MIYDDIVLKVALTELALLLSDSRGMDFTPRRSIYNDAGLDLTVCMSEECMLPPGGIKLVPLGVHIDFSSLPRPEEGMTWYGRMSVRSGTPGWSSLNDTGIIDFGYKGELMLKLVNSTNDSLKIVPGERIAQMVIGKCLLATTKVVPLIEFNMVSERGTECIWTYW